MTQEEIYDEKISPLMQQIIEVCKEHKIPMVASFACPNDEPEIGDSLRCTTALFGDNFIGKQDGFKEAFRILKRQPECLAITVMSAK